MNLSIAHKKALVCGGSAGIGKAAAIELAALGAHVTIMARNPDKLKAVLDELPNNGQQHHQFVAVDFTDLEVFSKTIDELAGKEPYEILVNNTGGPKGGPALAAAPKAYADAFAQHLMCNQILVQGLVAGMKAKGYGRIINVISTSVKQPIENLGVSNTIRGAVANWSKTLSTELGPFGITINNVLPGFTQTDRLADIVNSAANRFNKTPEEAAEFMRSLVPARRFASPQEVAFSIAFLASPAAGYINGINLPVDGGRTKSL
ncbi:MAG: SDR family oxidoreductase [Flavobacteriaceae bacterium]|nr:SDR family oxidoreductase [Flavobacteriaceae bacterium]